MSCRSRRRKVAVVDAAAAIKVVEHVDTSVDAARLGACATLLLMAVPVALRSLRSRLGRAVRFSSGLQNTKVLLLLMAVPAFAQPVSWHIDPLHSSAQFSVRHMMISTVRGQFGGVKGKVVFDPKNLGSATVEATIDCTTVNTGEPKRDSDLKTAEFFDVKKYPVMSFKSKRVDVAGPGKLKMTGDLTINAITREVVLDMEGPTPPIKDTQGREKVGISAETKISRKEFGILYNPILETGGVTVSDEVKIILEIELIKN